MKIYRIKQIESKTINYILWNCLSVYDSKTDSKHIGRNHQRKFYSEQQQQKK